MPDHIHILISLNKNYQKDLSAWVKSFKRLISKFAKNFFDIDRFWQKNYYDHILRLNESSRVIAQYILENPVRKNLVNSWEKYPHNFIDPQLYFS